MHFPKLVVAPFLLRLLRRLMMCSTVSRGLETAASARQSRHRFCMQRAALLGSIHNLCDQALGLLSWAAMQRSDTSNILAAFAPHLQPHLAVTETIL